MKTILISLLCFWVLWTGTKVSKTKDGGIQYEGGLFVPPLGQFVMTGKEKPGMIWNSSGRYFESFKDCEKTRQEYSAYYLVCAPNGVVPK